MFDPRIIDAFSKVRSHFILNPDKRVKPTFWGKFRHRARQLPTHRPGNARKNQPWDLSRCPRKCSCMTTQPRHLIRSLSTADSLLDGLKNDNVTAQYLLPLALRLKNFRPVTGHHGIAEFVFYLSHKSLIAHMRNYPQQP